MYDELDYLTYVDTLGPDNIPLSRALVWPDMEDHEAEFFVGRIEAAGARLIGAVPCGRIHDIFSVRVLGKPCPSCGAAV